MLRLFMSVTPFFILFVVRRRFDTSRFHAIAASVPSLPVCFFHAMPLISSLLSRRSLYADAHAAVIFISR